MNFSFWETDTYFRNIDFLIVGSGIVGLSTALHLRLKYPEAKILVVEKGMLPEGASTKNAGFTCFGTISEILWYLEFNPEDEIYSLIERRFKGLQKLRQIIGDKTMDYQQWGGYELFRKQDRDMKDKSFEKLEEINHWLFPIYNENPYHISTDNFGFKKTIGMIKAPLEGQIHTGKMMQTFMRLITAQNIAILNNIEITNISDNQEYVELELNHQFTIKSNKVLMCTNGFTQKLFDLDVVPARAQVLITKPIKNLKLKGCFHMDEGFYYFRNIQDRILFGGARNVDLEGETTSEFGVTEKVQNQLETYLKEIILPGQEFEIEQRWSGIMGMGSQRNPIVKQLSNNVYCGVRLTGTGVAIGSLVGEELANLL